MANTSRVFDGRIPFFDYEVMQKMKILGQNDNENNGTAGIAMRFIAPAILLGAVIVVGGCHSTPDQTATGTADAPLVPPPAAQKAVTEATPPQFQPINPALPAAEQAAMRQEQAQETAQYQQHVAIALQALSAEGNKKSSQ